MSDELLREVEEDIRRERLEKLWKRYRAPVLTAVAVLVLGTAGASFWQDHQQKKAGEAMQQLAQGVQAFEKGDMKIAADQFGALAASHGGEVRDIARLWQGRAQQASDQNEAALKSWRALAEKPEATDLLWRDMACLRLMSAEVADLPAGCISAQASPLAGQRQEWQAARLWQEGKTEEARTLLTALSSDATASPQQRARASRLLSALGNGK